MLSRGSAGQGVPPTPRKRRRGRPEERREEILQAARQLLEAEGPWALTVRGIAARVGLSGAALYAHFPSQAAIVEGVCRPALDALADRMNDETGPDAEATLRRHLLAYFDLAIGAPDLYRLAFDPLAGQAGGLHEATGAAAVWARLRAGVDRLLATHGGEARAAAHLAVVGAAHGVALLLTAQARTPEQARRLATAQAELLARMALGVQD